MGGSSSKSSGDLPTLEETSRIISRHGGTVILEFEEGVVLKGGYRVKPAEYLAMVLVSNNTKVPVPEPISCSFQPGYGEIAMPLVPGACLKDVWDDLDAEAKTSICAQIWKFVEEWRCIPKPPELQHLHACTVEGKLGVNSFISLGDWTIKDLESDIDSDEALRKRISENYRKGCGRRYTKEQLFDMLPRSDKPSVFTHGDLQPKNVMVSGSQVTGIIDWESAGWYPEYWECIAFSAPVAPKDWRTFMMDTAPQAWDLTGFDAASEIHF